MLGHRHEFDMREAHLFDVIDEGFGEFAITEGFSFRFLSPGTEMNLIDAERRSQGIGLLPLRQPSFVGPHEFGGVPNKRGVFRWHFIKETIRIGLLADLPLQVSEHEFVISDCRKLWNKYLLN